MTDAPFLTEVDPENSVKGSIDPLGMLALWPAYGNRVVGNLTLVGSSARGYTTLMLECWRPGLMVPSSVNTLTLDDLEAPAEAAAKDEWWTRLEAAGLVAAAKRERRSG